MFQGPLIQSIGIFIPTGRESNFDLLERFDITEEFVTRKIGVQTRAVKDKADDTSDLCVKAFNDLITTADIDLNQVGLVCVVTQNPDQKVPHTAAIVHQKLGLAKTCMTFDISQGCAGYPHGLSIVTSLMREQDIRSALLFTCDPYSKIVDPQDKNTALLFGDAATVTWITQGEHTAGYALQKSVFGTLPNSYSCLTCIDHLYMNGREIVGNALREVPENIRSLLKSCNLESRDVDLFVLIVGDAADGAFEATGDTAERDHAEADEALLALAGKAGLLGEERLQLAGEALDRR